MRKVFAVLVNYNGLADTLECLVSMKGKSDEYELTIVVVDNASERDETASIKKQFPDVIAIRSSTNGGFSYGGNIGIRYALENGADYIMLLNNDTVIAPDMISILLTECNENVVTVPKMLYYAKPDRIWYAGGRISRWTGSACHLGLNRPDDSSESSSSCSFATGCCIMMKAETIRKVGLLNEKYFLYYEDVEFSIRLAYENVRIKYIPAARLWHKVSSSTGGNRSRLTVYYATRNRLNCVKENRWYFHFTAYWFSLFTRYIRMIQSKDESIRKAIREGIEDHFDHRDVVLKDQTIK